MGGATLAPRDRISRAGRVEERYFGRAAPERRLEEAMARPIVGITMGDAAGIGPEIIMKGLARGEVHDICRPLVIGDAARLRKAGGIVGSSLKVNALRDPAKAAYRPGEVDCIDLALIPDDLPFGKLSAKAGDAAYRFVELAVELAQAGKIDAICTAPLNKEALHAGGHSFPGHTELLAKLSGAGEVSLMLWTPKRRVIHVTAHMGLLDAIERIDAALVERTIRRGHDALVRAGVQQPRIGVCGINPHAGEGGLFGRGEEGAKVLPAVEAARARGLDVQGPLPADALFYRAGRGDFDLVVAMYHDQGHGPVKVLGVESGVNITVGLPFVRTSVDHGTAFDIAGTGKADERSLVEALRQAVALAPAGSR
jgi:4-hydroxythreonine-4-phosphate dehydrogenase